MTPDLFSSVFVLFDDYSTDLLSDLC